MGNCGSDKSSSVKPSVQENPTSTETEKSKVQVQEHVIDQQQEQTSTPGDNPLSVTIDENPLNDVIKLFR